MDIYVKYNITRCDNSQTIVSLCLWNLEQHACIAFWIKSPSHLPTILSNLDLPNLLHFWLYHHQSVMDLKLRLPTASEKGGGGRFSVAAGEKATATELVLSAIQNSILLSGLCLVFTTVAVFG